MWPLGANLKLHAAKLRRQKSKVLENSPLLLAVLRHPLEIVPNRRTRAHQAMN